MNLKKKKKKKKGGGEYHKFPGRWKGFRPQPGEVTGDHPSNQRARALALCTNSWLAVVHFRFGFLQFCQGCFILSSPQLRFFTVVTKSRVSVNTYACSHPCVPQEACGSQRATLRSQSVLSPPPPYTVGSGNGQAVWQLLLLPTKLFH